MNKHKRVPTTTHKTVEKSQPQFANKVDDPVKVQRKNPQSKWRWNEAVERFQIRFRNKVVDSSCPTENGHRRTDAARTVPEREAKAKSQCREFRRRLSVRLLPGLSTKQPGIKNEVEMKAKPNAAEVKETSRAKSIWHVESNQIATVLNSIHQFKIQAHRLDRSRSAQEINKHVFGGINKDREDQRSERLQQIQSWVGRCHGHIPARDFDHWEGEAKNSAFLQKEIDTKEPEQHQDSSHQKELKVKSLQRIVFMMMKRTTEPISDVTRGNTAALVGMDQFLYKIGTLKTVENAHNTADTKYSVSHVAKIAVMSKDRCDSIRNRSIFPEKKQIYISVNNMNCDTADNKQEHFDEMKNVSNKKTGFGFTRSKKTFGGYGANDWEWVRLKACTALPVEKECECSQLHPNAFLTTSTTNTNTNTTIIQQNDSTQHHNGLALWLRVILNSGADRWVQARHPRYTRARKGRPWWPDVTSTKTTNHNRRQDTDKRQDKRACNDHVLRNVNSHTVVLDSYTINHTSFFLKQPHLLFFLNQSHLLFLFSIIHTFLFLFSINHTFLFFPQSIAPSFFSPINHTFFFSINHTFFFFLNQSHLPFFPQSITPSFFFLNQSQFLFSQSITICFFSINHSFLFFSLNQSQPLLFFSVNHSFFFFCKSHTASSFFPQLITASSFFLNQSQLFFFLSQSQLLFFFVNHTFFSQSITPFFSQSVTDSLFSSINHSFFFSQSPTASFFLNQSQFFLFSINHSFLLFFFLNQSQLLLFFFSLNHSFFFFLQSITSSFSPSINHSFFFFPSINHSFFFSFKQSQLLFCSSTNHTLSFLQSITPCLFSNQSHPFFFSNQSQPFFSQINHTLSFLQSITTFLFSNQSHPFFSPINHTLSFSPTNDTL